MSGNTPRKRLKQIAYLRSQGIGWAAVAEQLKLARAYVEHLVERHARLYWRLFRVELQHRVLESLAEANAVLRPRIRGKDFREQRDGIREVVRLHQLLNRPQPRAKTAPPREEEAAAYLHLLHTKTETELRQLCDEFIDQEVARRSSSRCRE